MWRGHKVRYATAGCGPAVVLVHGFGASSRHWRRNIGVLADAGFKVREGAQVLEGAGKQAGPVLCSWSQDIAPHPLSAQVYAIDLIGQGGSDKPALEYR